MLEHGEKEKARDLLHVSPTIEAEVLRASLRWAHGGPEEDSGGGGHCGAVDTRDDRKSGDEPVGLEVGPCDLTIASDFDRCLAGDEQRSCEERVGHQRRNAQRIEVTAVRREEHERVEAMRGERPDVGDHRLDECLGRDRQAPGERQVVVRTPRPDHGREQLDAGVAVPDGEHRLADALLLVGLLVHRADAVSAGVEGDRLVEVGHGDAHVVDGGEQALEQAVPRAGIGHGGDLAPPGRRPPPGVSRVTPRGPAGPVRCGRGSPAALG